MIGTAVSENNGALAQLGEHLLCKQGVIGSIPISSTIFAWPDRLSKKSGDFLGIWPWHAAGIGDARSRALGGKQGVSWSKSSKPKGFARPSGRRRSCGAPAQARPSQMAGTAVSENGSHPEEVKSLHCFCSAVLHSL